MYDILGDPKSRGHVSDQRELYVFCLSIWVWEVLNGQARCLPDLIKGDLDSIRDDVRRYYIKQV